MNECVDCGKPLGTNNNCEYCCEHWVLEETPEQLDAKEAAQAEQDYKNSQSAANPYEFDDSLPIDLDEVPTDKAAQSNNDIANAAMVAQPPCTPVADTVYRITFPFTPDAIVAHATDTEATVTDATPVEATAADADTRIGECDVQGNVELEDVQGNVHSNYVQGNADLEDDFADFTGNLSEIGVRLNQDGFNNSFYTALQIIDIIGVGRQSFYNRVRKGYLGEPIKLFPNVLIFPRTPVIEHKIRMWQKTYAKRMHRMGK